MTSLVAQRAPAERARLSVARRQTSPTARLARRGLTLMEVILALTVFGLSLAALSQLLRLGADNAQAARDLTVAELLAESKITELAASGMAVQPVLQAEFSEYEAEPGWWYSVDMEPLAEGLLAVQVTVHQDPSTSSRPVEYSLVRWMLDPQYEMQLELEAEMLLSSSDPSAGSSFGSGPQGSGP